MKLVLGIAFLTGGHGIGAVSLPSSTPEEDVESVNSTRPPTAKQNSISFSSQAQRDQVKQWLAAGKYALAHEQLKSITNTCSDAEVLGLISQAQLGLGLENEATETLQRIVTVKESGVLEVWAHLQLACIYEHRNERELAIGEFSAAESKIGTNNEAWTLENLWNASSKVGEVALAINYGEAFLAKVGQTTCNTQAVAAIQAYVDTWKPKQKITFFNNSEPLWLSEDDFNKVAYNQLDGEDVKRVIYPLHVSPEVRLLATKLARGATNHMTIARDLFDALLQKSVTAGPPVFRSHSMTGQQVLSRFQEGVPAFDCQQWAFLYVILARSLGLRAYVVEVQTQYDDQRLPHACAGVYLDSDLVLVDVAREWFGVPHKQFAVLDDLSATAMFLSDTDPESSGATKCKEIAARLGRRLPLAQANHAQQLMDFGEWEQAKTVMETLSKIDTNQTFIRTVKARYAMHEEKWDKATELLQSAISARPNDVVPRRLLGMVFLSQEKYGEAIRVFHEASGCPVSKEQAESLRGLIAATQGILNQRTNAITTTR